MIKNISKLKNLGIFSNYQKENETSDFVKFNLVYGWNGSGKSTLSTLFQGIEERQVPLKFPGAEFAITLADGTLITQSSINNSTTNISIFNQNFIQKNINWDSSVKSILLVSEEKISEINKLEKLKLQLEIDTRKNAERHKKINTTNKNISDFLSTSARNTKEKFQILDTKDTYYLNYNKTKIEDFIKTNQKALKDEASLLSDSDVIKVTLGAKPDKKQPVTTLIKKIDEEIYKKAKERLEKLFATSIASKTIERLKDNPDIQSWVSTGLDLHKKHNVDTCEFCQNLINKDRLKEIEQHFSDDFKEFKLRLINADQWLENQYIKIEFLPSYDSFYNEFQTDYKQACESALSNETIGADKFNDALHKFIGRSEISIRFNSALKGYEITRNNFDGHAKNLSEGEKTAIAFIYFIIKLKENGNKINETIIVVDDPISSFDSNHLFHAYSFLKNHCGDAKQLFVFTHNFTFFKLIRDWLIKKNKFNNATKEFSIKSNFYTIEATATVPRISKILNSDKSLTEYNSEYHYLFSKLYHFKEHQSLTIDEAFIAANLARKLMESLLSFKFPKKRNDFNQLIECGIKDEIIREKVYRFINKYSHNMSIEINEESSDNIMGESKSVINDIFSCIKMIDDTHYQEMVEIVSAAK